MSASFCVEKYMRMAIVEHIKKERPDYSEKLVNEVADESVKHLSEQPMRAWSRAIELAAIEKPRGNICRWTEKIDDLGFRTLVSHCEHSYRNKGEAEFCPGCGRRIEIVEGDAEPKLKLLKTAPNTDFNLTKRSND